jgi:hypothetical protein
VGHAAHTGEMIITYKILVRKSERKRPLRRPRHRWEDNTGLDLREIGWESMEWLRIGSCYRLL